MLHSTHTHKFMTTKRAIMQRAPSSAYRVKERQQQQQHTKLILRTPRVVHKTVLILRVHARARTFRLLPHALGGFLRPKHRVRKLLEIIGPSGFWHVIKKFSFSNLHGCGVQEDDMHACTTSSCLTACVCVCVSMKCAGINAPFVHTLWLHKWDGKGVRAIQFNVMLLRVRQYTRFLGWHGGDAGKEAPTATSQV